MSALKVLTAFIAFAGAMLPAGIGSAGSSTSAIDDLRTELESRRDNDFGGTLDAAQKKRQKAVLKCLALFDVESSGELDDAKKLESASRLIEKAYPDEMDPFVYPLGELYVLIDEAFESLRPLRDADMADLEDLVGRLVPGPALRKAAKALAAAKAGRDKYPGLQQSLRARQLVKSWEILQRALPSASVAEVLPEPFAEFTAGGVPLSTTDVSWKYDPTTKDGNAEVVLLITAIDESAREHYLSIIVVVGAQGEEWDLRPWTDYVLGSAGSSLTGGTFSASKFDLAGHEFEGAFSLTMDHDGESILVSGTFRATWDLEIEGG